MCYFPYYILYSILAVGFMNFEVSKGLQLTIKLGNLPKFRRQMSGENDTSNFYIQKNKNISNESDPYNTNTHWSKRFDSKKRNSMNIDESMAVVLHTSDWSSSLEMEDISERDDSSTKKTTARATPKKHKKTYTKTKLYTTRNAKYEIPTTMKKERRVRNGEGDDHRQKSVRRHLEHLHNKKINSVAKAIHKTSHNVRPNDNLLKTDILSFATFRDIILHVLKTIRTGGHLVNKYPYEVPILRLEDIKHEIEKENDLNSFKQKFRRRYSDKTQKEFDKKIDATIGDLANKTSHIWQSWVRAVTENDKINSIKNISIYKSRRSTDNALRNLIMNLSIIYDDEFSNLTDNTNFSKVENSTGLEKTILNTIYLIDHFIKWISNFIIDSENKDEHSEDSELSDETNVDFTRACMRLGVCRTRNSFTAFVMDFLTILLSLDNNKFEEAFDSLSDDIRSNNFSPALGDDLDEGLKNTFAKHGDQNLVHKRSLIAMIKRIFSNRQAPLILFSDDKIAEVNKTVAFIQIINTLDEEVPDSADNIQTWNSITRSFLNYEENRDNNIKSTISNFVRNMIHVISELDAKSKYQVLDGLKVIFT